MLQKPTISFRIATEIEALDIYINGNFTQLFKKGEKYEKIQKPQFRLYCIS